MIPVSAEKLLEVGVALSREKDGDALLETILGAAMDITECDAGTLYIRTGDALAFRIMVTRSQNIFKGGGRGEIDLPPVGMDRSNVCACAAITGELYNIGDVYEERRYDFSGPRKYDAITGYRTKSMLVVPMEDDRGDVIGVLQLLNAQNEAGETVAFDPYYETVLRSLAAQAAICLTNMNYAEEIVTLLNSFVKVMSTAIDARTPYNANHSRNMARCGERFIDWLNENDEGWRFGERERRQFIMSVWLHDVGKLVIPLEVMNKSSRLGKGLGAVLHRLETVALRAKIAFLEGKIDEAELRSVTERTDKARALVESADKADSLGEDTLASVRELGCAAWTTPEGEELRFLTSEEEHALSVRRGTLTDEERTVMESHVAMTERMLREMAFTRDYCHVPEWAGMHHELLNGKGYPRGLADGALPREARLLTILDIFDALTARDRPYKPPMPSERAFAVLASMAEKGELDGDILEKFKRSEAWKL